MFTGVARTAVMRMPTMLDQAAGRTGHDAHAGSLAAMRIVRVAAYRQLQPFRDGPYICRNQSADGTDSTIVVLESDDGLVGVGEMAPLGAFYAPAFAAGTRAGRRRARAAPAGRRPARAGACAAVARCRHARPAERQVRARHGRPRPRGAGGGRAALLLPRRPLRHGRRPLPLGLAGHARRDGAQCRRLRRGRLPAHPGQGRRRPGRGRRARARRARRRRGGRRAVLRRQRRLDDRAGARVPARDARSRDHAGAALHVLRRLPHGTPALPAPDGAGRVHRLAPGAARRAPRRRGGRRDDQDRPRGRRRSRGAAARRGGRARPAGHRRGHGRQRHRHRRDGAPLALDAGGAAHPHGRLQRLGHGRQRHGHAACRGRAAARARRSGPRRRGSARGAGRAVRRLDASRRRRSAGHQARVAAAIVPAAAASPPTTSARTRSGSSVVTITPWRSTARRPTSGSTSRIAVTASAPCSSAASRRSRNAAASPASATTAATSTPHGRSPVARSRRRRSATAAIASAPTSTWRHTAPARERQHEARARRDGRARPERPGDGRLRDALDRASDLGPATVDAQRHAPAVQRRAVRAGVVEAQRVPAPGAQPRGVARVGAPGLHREHGQDRRSLARPRAARVELQRGRALQVEHLHDARPVPLEHEVRPVGRDAGVRAGRLRQHDVAGVVHEAADRVGGGARGQRQHGDQTTSAATRVIPRRPGGTRPPRS